MPIYFYATVVVDLILGVMVIVLAAKVVRRNALLVDLLQTNAEITDTAARVLEEMTYLIDVIEPLLEKTDWMTGRWGGQFNVLVRMEERRNKIIDDIRRYVMGTYPVESLVAEDPASLIPTMNLVPGASL